MCQDFGDGGGGGAGRGGAAAGDAVGDVGGALGWPGVFGDDFAVLVGKDDAEPIPDGTDGLSCSPAGDEELDTAELDGAVLADGGA